MVQSNRFPKSVKDDPFRQAVFRYQSGFTLLEMMVVAALLLVVAGGVVTSFRDVGSDASEQAARYQMQQIGDAIEAYYTDTGVIPSRETPADLAFLFIQPTSIGDWNPDYRRGWRGPYLSGHKYLYVDIGDDLTASGADATQGQPYFIYNTELESVVAIADPFDHYPVDEGVSRSNDGCHTSTCLLEWRKVSEADSTLFSQLGRPYLAIDLDLLAGERDPFVPGAARLVSLGSNGVYEPNSCDYAETDESEDYYCSQDLLCSSSGDDIVLCLR
ncbi:prepilin-type N-terminal cleavage/methylation domain-containing protein [Neptuniibacter marinus]|uniref:prepilin-type N-terminal cleavage/methylation domain-containing protein n=1 Tax=Neptuniibacter marinus TaxID=1806670 RepID=UPI003B58D576